VHKNAIVWWYRVQHANNTCSWTRYFEQYYLTCDLYPQYMNEVANVWIAEIVLTKLFHSASSNHLNTLLRMKALQFSFRKNNTKKTLIITGFLREKKATPELLSAKKFCISRH